MYIYMYTYIYVSDRGFIDIDSREYTPIPDYPRHDDDDVFNYF